ncbi:MAG: hypothetical protein HZB99_02245 [Candidatus Harrisonbacteria bacterium]|nr:hypothetical protein [Candidatus Harrisonbacteria bacterium]
MTEKQKQAKEQLLQSLKPKLRNEKFLLVSYNAVEGFESGIHGNGRLIIFANDIGRGFLTREDGTLDRELQERCNQAFAAVEKELNDTSPENFTVNKLEGALRSAQAKNPELPIINGSNKGMEDARAKKVMQNLSGKAKEIVLLRNIKFVIIYAGLHAFKSAIELAKSVKKQNKNTRILVVSCPCDWHDKEQLLEGTSINIMGCECGGRLTMGMIAKDIEKLISE